MPRKLSWVHSRFPKLSALFDSRFAAVSSMVAAVGSTFALISLASLGQWDFWGPVTPILVALAPLVLVPTVYMLLGDYVARQSTHQDLSLGLDGIIANGEFIHWAELTSVSVKKHADRQQSLVLSLRSGRTLTLPSISPPAARSAEAAFRHFQNSPEPPSLEESEGLDHYRTSKRPALVRIATNPKSEPAERVRAAEYLAQESALNDQVFEAMDESLDPEIRRFTQKRKH